MGRGGPGASRLVGVLAAAVSVGVPALPAALPALPAALPALPDALPAQAVPPGEVVPLEVVREDADGDGRADRLGDTVTVAGRAAVASGVLYSERLDVSIQNRGRGIFLYRRSIGEPVGRGDSVVARGVLRDYAGKLQVNVLEYRVVPGPRRFPEPTTVEIADRRFERAEGTLVSVEGRLVSSTSNAGGRLLILQGFADPGERVSVFVRNGRLPSFDLTRFEEGDRIRVTGLAGQFDPDPSRDGLYQIYPLGPERLEIVGVAADTWRRLAWAGGGVLLLALLLWAWSLRRQARQRREAQQRYESLFAWNASPVAELGPADEIRRSNDAFDELMGFGEGEAAGRPFLSLVGSGDAERLRDGLRTARDGDSEALEVTLTTSRGETVDTEVVTVPISVDGRIEGVFVIAQDITDRKRFEERLRRRALHDYLTGLPNRALLTDRLDQALQRAARDDASVVVLYVDLDRFKMINDNAGHAVGDEVLRTVADRLRLLSRASDTVARVGGDEFVVLLEEVAGRDEARAVAERILATLDRPVEIDDRSLHISASVGVSVSSADADAEQLIRQSDRAMYRAKKAGGSQQRMLDEELDPPATDLLRLDHELRLALERDELYLDYQPLVDLQTRRLVGLEALVRWRHPEQGRLAPGYFVPLAEETGLVVELDRWVVRRAWREVSEWMRTECGDRELILSVNFSAVHLKGPDPLAVLEPVAADGDDGGPRLQVEITESAFAREPALLNRLRELGYLLAVDDFGTGYSSLRYLQELQVDTLKLDRSFVARLGSDTASTAIARTVVTLGRNLGVRVVAEGIEGPEQLRTLREFGCPVGQGILLGRPASLEELAIHVAQPG